jgi:hypothetical protein
MSQDEFLALLKQHPPKDAGTCAGYLKDKVQKARLCFQRTPYADRIERLVEHRQTFTTVFFPRLLMVLLWMSSYEDAAMAVLDLCVYTKMDCLHARVPFFTGEDHQLAHRELDGILRVTLRSIQHSQRYYRRYAYDAQTHAPYAAHLCRYIRSFNTRLCYCEHPFPQGAPGVPHDYANRGCVQVNTAVALDLLERHAYIDIKLNVYRAAGRELPKELVDIVLRYALLAEKISEEPGVFDRLGKGVIECGPDYTFEISRSELL